MSKSDKILILLLYGIGDVVCYLPALRVLRKSFPQAEIHLMTGPKIEEFIINQGLIEACIEHDSGQASPSNILRLIKRLRTERYDTIIATAQTGSWKTPVLAYMTGAQARIGNKCERLSQYYTHTVSIDMRLHYVERELQMLSALGIDAPAQTDDEIVIPDCDIAHATSLLESFIQPDQKCIGLASGSDVFRRGRWKPWLKKWPVEKYRQLAKLLLERGYGIVLFGGVDAKGWGESVKAEQIDMILDGIGRWELPQAAAMLSKCDCLVCNDTGLGHLAAGLRIPVVSLFGPTDPDICGPRGEKVVVVQGRGACRACFPNPGCNSDSCVLMEAIEVEEVIHGI